MNSDNSNNSARNEPHTTTRPLAGELPAAERAAAVTAPNGDDVRPAGLAYEVLDVSVDGLVDTCAREVAAGARLLTVVATDERERNGAYRLRYLFARPPHSGGTPSPAHRASIASVELRVDPAQPWFPSAAAVVPAAHWDEREVRDLFGLEPRGHPDPRRLVLHDAWPADRFPLRREASGRPLTGLTAGRRAGGVAGVGPATALAPLPERHPRHATGEGVMEVPVGPIHAGIIEPGHFRFSTVGERILHLDARLFYTHRGLEKSAEGLPLARALVIAERLCGVCSAANAAAYCQAVEALGGLDAADLPPRARYIRAVALELERLYNHIGDVGNVCAGVGFAAGTMHGARLRERLLRLNETVLGHRYLRGVSAPGGVRRGLCARYAEGLSRELFKVQREFDRYCDLLTDTDSLQERLRGTGVLPREAAAALGVVGVAARASGVDVDLRRDLPYGAYAWHQDAFGRDAATAAPAVGAWPPPVRSGLGPWRVGPSHAAAGVRGVPVYADGDVRARVQVRIDEAHRSFALLHAFLEPLRDPGSDAGPLRVPVPAPVPYYGALGWVESPRGATLHWLMADERGRVFRYHVRTGSYATWPAVALTAPGNMIPDFPLINKSFELCYSCCDR